MVLQQVICETYYTTVRDHNSNKRDHYPLTLLCCSGCEMHLCESKHVRCICISNPCYENISSYIKLLKMDVFTKCLSYRVLLGHISMLLGEYTSEAPVLCLP